MSLLALVGVAVSGVLQMRGLLAAEEQQTVQAVAQALGNAAELALAVRDETERSRLADRFMENPQIALITVCDKNGKLAVERARAAGLWERSLQGNRDRSLIFHEQPVTLAAANEFSTTPDTGPAETVPQDAPMNVGRVVVGLCQTPGGVGMGMKPPRYLQAGDRVVVRVEGIGELANPVEMEHGE